MNPGGHCVVISFYDQRDRNELVQLLAGMQRFDAGAAYRILIVVNSTGNTPLQADSLPLNHLIEIVTQPNRGYNIGAWETGWRHVAADSYLFLQQECRIRRRGWLQAFLEKAKDPQLGLLGESRMVSWAVPWEQVPEHDRFTELPEHEVDGVAVRDRVDCYLHHLKSWGIDPGPTADHLQSLILFARRDVLETIDGFPVGNNYGEAIASEIGISRKVVSAGYRIEQVGPDKFTWIEHPQWSRVTKPSLIGRVWGKLRRYAGRLTG